MDYRYGSHTVYNLEYHFVWVTKYRYKVLTGDVALRVRVMWLYSSGHTETRTSYNV
jgi:putative transposase